MEELTRIVDKAKSDIKKVIFGCGCFDIIHVGHVRYLEKAKKLGDMLIIALNNDDSVRKLKGANMPVTNESERAEILSAIEYVDYLLIFPEIRVSRYLKSLKPHIFCKGNDYTIETISEEEKDAVRSYGGEIVIVPTYVKSSSDLIKKIESF